MSDDDYEGCGFQPFTELRPGEVYLWSPERGVHTLCDRDEPLTCDALPLRTRLRRFLGDILLNAGCRLHGIDREDLDV